jgi:hypothetical protein
VLVDLRALQQRHRDARDRRDRDRERPSRERIAASSVVAGSPVAGDPVPVLVGPVAARGPPRDRGEQRRVAGHVELAGVADAPAGARHQRRGAGVDAANTAAPRSSRISGDRGLRGVDGSLEVAGLVHHVGLDLRDRRRVARPDA